MKIGFWDKTKLLMNSGPKSFMKMILQINQDITEHFFNASIH